MTRRVPLTLTLYFYPRPPRGGRLECREHAGRNQCISIHALREEGDLSGFSRVYLLSYFYPRPPRGGRLLLPLTAARSSIFLSTPSARRATCRAGPSGRSPSHFYPRPPRGGRRIANGRAGGNILISIHALREEGDRMQTRQRALQRIFLSTPSARRATPPLPNINHT